MTGTSAANLRTNIPGSTAFQYSKATDPDNPATEGDLHDGISHLTKDLVMTRACAGLGGTSPTC